MIAPFSLYVPSMFLTLIGDFNMHLLHLCAIDLSMNRPSAPQSIKAANSSVFSMVSTFIGIENLRFDIDHTVTCDKSRLSVGVESIGIEMLSTVKHLTSKNPVQCD